MRRDEIVKTILEYIVDHPESADTVEGIMTWWIASHEISLRIGEVAQSLEWLAEKKILILKKIDESNSVYMVNKEKLSEVQSLLSFP